MKLYLVNGESIVSIPFQTDYLLQTFFNISRRNIVTIEQFIERRGQDNFILDSGAFSLFSGAGKKIDYNFLKKYIDKYCDFILKYEIKQFVEMDIDIIIGYDEVKKINKYIENRVGRKPLYVHHNNTRTIDDLKGACDEYDYLFFGGLTKEKNSEIIGTFINFCFQCGTKVHTLGYTPLDIDTQKNLYSCDSSSWTMGGRNGNIYQFYNDKLTTIKLKDKRRVTFFELNNHNLKQWLKYQAYLKNYGWITE